MTRPVLLVPLMLAISSCASLHPHHTQELKAEIDPAWSEYIKASGLSAGETSLPVWQTLGDPVLNELISQLDAANPDLAATRAKLAEARAIQRAEEAGLGPSISTSASVTAQRLSETGSLPVGQIPGFEADQVLYDVGFDALWELDLFGRKNTERSLSAANVALAEQRLAAARFSLTAELSRAYFDAIANRRELAFLRDAVALQESILEAVKIRRAHGEASDVDVGRSQAALADYRARIAPQEAAAVSAFYRLSVLAGQEPGAFQIELPEELPVPASAMIDFNSAIMRQRPDVREAEITYVQAARASDLATLDLYPRFTLFGGAGPNTTDLADFLDPASLALNVGAMAEWSLYDGGHRLALADAADMRLDQAEANYRSTVLNAMADIETAAANWLKAAESLSGRRKAKETRLRLVDMAEARFAGGTGTRIEVLEAQRDLADANLAETEAFAAWLVARVALDKATGSKG